jgi:hypothetical protein
MGDRSDRWRTVMKYDPLKAPEPEDWLAIDEN